MNIKFLGRLKLSKIIKFQGKRKFSESMRNALNGISYVTQHERNFKIEIIMGILVLILGILLKVSILEWLVLIITISLVLCFEIINTAIERCVDLVTKDYKELAKITKDVAAGAVLVMSMFATIIGIVIFLPKLINLL